VLAAVVRVVLPSRVAACIEFDAPFYHWTPRTGSSVHEINRFFPPQ
jgi:hypothetical protein